MKLEVVDEDPSFRGKSAGITTLGNQVELGEFVFKSKNDLYWVCATSFGF
jgi:hypothetical protein